VFLVSHDRSFLDAVVTDTIAYEGEGRWQEYPGGVEDWLVQSKRAQEARAAGATPAAHQVKEASKPTAAPPQQRSGAKLSYKEKRELETLPQQIEKLEEEQAELRKALVDGSIYAKDPRRAAELHERDATIEDELMTALTRWEELSAKE
jgi:ATP-binding cassette subfamily F protein uup